MENNSNVLTLQIEDRKYGMRKMPPLMGSRFGIRVAACVSKLLSQPRAKDALLRLQASQGKGLDNVEAATFGMEMMSLLSSVDPDELSGIFRDALAYEVYYGNSRLSDEVFFEEHFSKYPGDLYVVEAWAAYNHVRDFFTGLGAGLKALTSSSGAQGAPDASSPRARSLTGL